MGWRIEVAERMATKVRPVGEQLREWRMLRRMSQLDLALEANISARHLSFLETGRAKPSKQTLLNLADRLEIPFRERNVLLLGAGLAPAYPHRSWDDPSLAHLRATIEQLLKAHEPFPALVIDRHWNLLAANRTVDLLIGEVDPSLLTPPLNVLRLSLHPLGLASRIRNLPSWSGHVLHRLRHQYLVTADQELKDLATELALYATTADVAPSSSDIIVPLEIDTAAGSLSLVSTTTVFGTPLDITLSELALETFLPADDATAKALRSALS